MQQQSPQTMKTQPLFPLNTITTDEIQKYLDENKRLILGILENQSLGKLTECGQYQAQLQKNLMYLAAIADAQPPAPTMPSQTPLQSAVQQEHHMQQPQAALTQQQPNVLTPKLPFHLNALQSRDQQQQLLLQQQQLFQGHMGMRPPGANTSMHHQAMQTGPGTSGSLARTWGSKQDLLETGSGGNQGNSSASGRGSGDRDSQL